MKLRRLDPKSIQVPEVRVTARFDDETLAMFKTSIKEAGQVAPIICCEVDGTFVLVDGLHRLQEAIANGVERIDVAVITGDMVDVLTKNIFLDHLRGKTPVTEMVTVIEALWKEYGLDSERIAEKTGLTRDYVEKLQLISELTPYCREALDQGRILLGHAAALTKIKDPDRQEMVCRQQELYRWRVKELEAYIKEVLAMVEAKVEAEAGAVERIPNKVKCIYCGGEYDPSEVACPITCRSCSGVMFASIRQAQVEAESSQRATEKTKGSE